MGIWQKSLTNMESLDFESIQAFGQPNFKFSIWNNGGVGQIITAVLPYIFYAAGIALLVYLVSGGLQLMLSRGDPKAVQTAQGKITTSIIGFVIIFTAYWLTQILGDMLGIGVFKDIFK